MDRIGDDAAKATRAAAVLEVLAHPVRLQIVALLCHDEADAQMLVSQLRLPAETVAWHLRVLASERLVDLVDGSNGGRYHVIEPVLYGLVACSEEWTS